MNGTFFNTADGTATPTDVKSGETVYVKGKLIVGIQSFQIEGTTLVCPSDWYVDGTTLVVPKKWTNRAGGSR